MTAPTVLESAPEASFPPGFAWGAATAAYQIEGGVTEDGRGVSIWDTFAHTPGRVLDGLSGDVACDHYRRWREDVRLLRELGLSAYRLSIAWPRIVPDGTGSINQAGLDWYARLIDALREASIEPWVTLYHWNLPQALEDAGGWPMRATADAFATYVDAVSRCLGDRVRHWITLNEPWCSAFLGYLTAEHAPGRRNLRAALQAAHTLLVAHGRAVEIVRTHSPAAQVGIALNPTVVEPQTDAPADLAAARRYDGYLNRWFLDPLYGRGYPVDLLDWFAPHLDWLAPQLDGAAQEDLRTIAAGTDFLGVNYYSPHVVRSSPGHGPLDARSIRPDGARVTEMG